MMTGTDMMVWSAWHWITFAALARAAPAWRVLSVRGGVARTLRVRCQR